MEDMMEENEFILLNPEKNSNFASMDIKEEPAGPSSDASDSSGDMEEEFISLNREQDSNAPLIADIKEEPELIISDSDESDSSNEVGDENYSEEPINPSGDERMVSKLSIPPINDCTLICTKCAECFENVHHLNKHYFKKHNIGAQVEDLDFKAIDGSIGHCHYQCTKCPKNYQGKKLLFLHSTQHDVIKMFRCNNCDMHFKYYKNIITHNCRKSKKKYGSFIWKHVIRLCPSCGKEYKSGMELRQHLLQDHKFNDIKNINVVKVKSKKLQFKCTVCDYLFDTRLIANLRTHAFLHMKYKLFNCQQCAISCDTEDEIMRHLYVDHHIEIKSNSNVKYLEMENVEFQCPDCGVELQSRMAFTEHMNVEHRLNTLSGQRVKRLRRGQFECLDCNAKLTRYSRIHHRMSHMPYKPYRCGFCKHQFVQTRGALAHLLKCKRKHLKASLRKESKINAKNNADNKINVKKEKSEDPLSVEPTTLPEISKVRVIYRNERTPVLNEFGKYMSYACPECNIPLPTSTDWHTHISLNHNFFDEHNLKSIKTLDGKYKCTDCGTLTESSISQRQRHKLTHMPHKSFICTLCGHRSKTFNVLFAHIRRCHFTKGEYKCIMCPEVFETSFKCIEHCKTEHSEHEYPPHCCKICLSVLSSNYSFKNHMKLHDYDRTMHKCVGCARVFLWTSDLHKHVKQKHPDLIDLIVQCEFCNSKFYDRLVLEEHLKIHDGAKIGPTTCKFCHTFLRTSNNLKHHMKKVHSEMRRHACNYCDCQFSLLSRVRVHIEKFHPDEMFAFISSHRESELEDEDETLPPVTEWELENGEFEKINAKKSPKPRKSNAGKRFEGPKRKRGRPRKLHATKKNEATTSSDASDDEEYVPKRKIDRPRKQKPIVFDISSEESELTEDEEFDADLKSVSVPIEKNPDEPKRKRGRPRKIQTAIEMPKNIKCYPEHFVIKYINENDGSIENDEIVETLKYEIVKEEVVL